MILETMTQILGIIRPPFYLIDHLYEQVMMIV